MLGRAHEELVIDDLPAGEYLLVVDSWSNAAGEIFDGSFTVAFDVVQKNTWTDVPLGDGVTWSRWRGVRGGRTQTMNGYVFRLNSWQTFIFGPMMGALELLIMPSETVHALD